MNKTARSAPRWKGYACAAFAGAVVDAALSVPMNTVLALLGFVGSRDRLFVLDIPYLVASGVLGAIIGSIAWRRFPDGRAAAQAAVCTQVTVVSAIVSVLAALDVSRSPWHLNSPHYALRLITGLVAPLLMISAIQAGLTGLLVSRAMGCVCDNYPELVEPSHAEGRGHAPAVGRRKRAAWAVGLALWCSMLAILAVPRGPTVEQPLGFMLDSIELRPPTVASGWALLVEGRVDEPERIRSAALRLGNGPLVPLAPTQEPGGAGRATRLGGVAYAPRTSAGAPPAYTIVVTYKDGTQRSREVTLTAPHRQPRPQRPGL